MEERARRLMADWRAEVSCFPAKREPIKSFEDLFLAKAIYNLAVTALCVPYSLDSGLVEG